MYHFINKQLYFYSYPDDSDLYGLTLDELRGFLDIFTSVCISLLEDPGILKREEIPIFRPFNLLIGTYKEYLVFGFTDEKAIKNLTTVGYIVNDLNDSIHEDLNRIADYNYGFKIKQVVKFNLDIVINSKHFIKKYLETIMNEPKELIIPVTLAHEIKREVLEYRDQIFKERDRMLIKPIFKTKDITIDQTLCFTLLPFDNSQIEIFDEIITPIVKNEFQMQILRANDIFGTNEIMEDIWNYICKSKFLIADITGKNPNVFYELGICHTVGKEVIMICEEDSYNDEYNNKFPFDIAHRRIIIYKNTGPGMERFKRDLINTIRSVLSGEKEVSG
jgi:hypothetical protein